MKAIMVMYDSLNLHMLEPYGCDWTHTPNFARAAQKCAQFCNNYVGSMPCMPARRELHTGRCNFLHHGWGPLEPYDDSMPELLGQNGIHTHLISDHQHYWEDGGGTYHTRYSTWENTRGQEGDPWKYDHRVTSNFESGFKSPHSAGAAGMAKLLGEIHRNDATNRALMPTEADQPQSKTFALGLEFLQANHDADNWFLQIETFDPHEPFFTQQQYRTCIRTNTTALRWTGLHIILCRRTKNPSTMCAWNTRRSFPCAMQTSARCWILWTHTICGRTPC